MTTQHGSFVTPSASSGLRHLWSFTWSFTCVVSVACKPTARDDQHPVVEPYPDLPESLPASPASPMMGASGAGDTVPELPPGIHQQTIRGADGATQRYTILIPERYVRTARVPLVVLLHYGGAVTPFYGRGMIEGYAEPAFRAWNAILIAPDSLGGDWTTEQNGAAVVGLVGAVMKSYAIDPQKVVLSGYSMGGIGTWFIGAKNQDLFTAAIPVASAPAGGSDWRIPLYVIHSRDDQILPIAPVRDHVTKLKASGLRMEWRELSGITHYQTGAYAPALGEAARWLDQVWRETGAPPPH